MVRCVDCGFLAVRNQINRQLDEVEAIYRQRGKGPLRGDGVIHEEPECYMKSYNLQGEFNDNAGDSRTRWRNIFNKERECTSFFQHREGFTPKEHREMLDRQEILKWQASREDADRKWRTRQQWYMVIIAGIFAILGGVIVLLAKGCS